MRLLARVTAVLGIAVGVLPAAGGTVPSPAALPAAARSVHDFTVRTADGTERSLAEYRGYPVLIVNTASLCGFTPQYDALEKLYERYHARGFEVLAFPANNFLAQEPGSDSEIQTFCRSKYNVRFPVFAKISVRGGDIAPLYKWLTRRSGFDGDIPWKFTKFLVGPDGRVVARFAPPVEPLDPRIVGPLEKLLAAR